MKKKIFKPVVVGNTQYDLISVWKRLHNDCKQMRKLSSEDFRKIMSYLVYDVDRDAIVRVTVPDKGFKSALQSEQIWNLSQGYIPAVQSADDTSAIVYLGSRRVYGIRNYENIHTGEVFDSIEQICAQRLLELEVILVGNIVMGVIR